MGGLGQSGDQKIVRLGHGVVKPKTTRCCGCNSVHCARCGGLGIPRSAAIDPRSGRGFPRWGAAGPRPWGGLSTTARGVVHRHDTERTCGLRFKAQGWLGFRSKPRRKAGRVRAGPAITVGTKGRRPLARGPGAACDRRAGICHARWRTRAIFPRGGHSARFGRPDTLAWPSGTLDHAPRQPIAGPREAESLPTDRGAGI